MENLIKILNNEIKEHNISYGEEGKRVRIYIDGSRTDITLPNTDVEESSHNRVFAERELIKILVTKINNFLKD